MMKKSLQTIEDYYYQKGLRGTKLRHATEKDLEYMNILREKWSNLTKKFEIRPSDIKKYVMSTDQDYEILGMVYILENKKLSDKDKELVKLVKTQLEHHWRTPVIKFLNKLLQKYK